MRQLMLDAEKVHKDLEMLERDHADWAREHQQRDLMHLMEHVKRLEFDLSTILSDCVSLGRQYWKEHNLQVIESLHRSYGILNNLFQDLKKVRTALNRAYIKLSDLEQLIIDWGRFKKSIDQTQESMEYPHGRRKNYAWACHGSLKAGGCRDEAFKSWHESSRRGS
jgi:hypothetical protein